jgi:hypothetical protein
MKVKVFWDVASCRHVEVDRRVLPSSFIALIMEDERSSETSVNFNVTTWHYIPKDSKLHLLE